MTRYFEEHRKREVCSLNGAWKFIIDPDNAGEAENWQNGLPTGETVIVPSMWNNEMGLLEYEGVAWYQKEFYSEGGCLRFCFGGVMTEAKVWLDDCYLGSHYGGFCQFDFIAQGVAGGNHLLTVRVDNHFDEHSIPQTYVDWYHYGGISRDVTVETLKGICVLYNRLEYDLNEDLNAADCRFVLELYNSREERASSNLCITLGGKTVYQQNIVLEAGEHLEFITPSFVQQDIVCWNMEAPYLYPLVFETETDDLRDRVGFRKISIEDGRIRLNDKALELRGVNRHEEHPDWGFAFPEKLMKRDIDLIADLGCNAIRGSHYPNSPSFVDMLDERGMLFWSEIPIWGCGFSAEALGDPIIVERGLNMHKEMVKYYYNHPSIVIWGMHNEIILDTQGAYEMSKTYYGFLKEHGGNRLVTYASYMPLKDICLEFCDFISINEYYGWYHDTIQTWAVFLDEMRSRFQELGMGDKPVVISEFGAAALYGQHTFDNLRWTEEYQANLLSYCLDLFHRDPMVAGSYIWQFCDIRTSQEAGLMRARGYNNKGILNEYRRPKNGYFAAKNAFMEMKKDEEAAKKPVEHVSVKNRNFYRYSCLNKAKGMGEYNE